MILPDVNLLIHAHDRDSSRHDVARTWWEAALSGSEIVGLAWVTILGFIRITTSRAILHHPLAIDDALERVEAWLRQPNVRLVQPTHRHADLLAGFLREAGTGGNLTTDAHLAALAVEHGFTLYSTDADFGRFTGLSWRNPLAQG